MFITSRRGFTLIELVITMVVLAIVVSVAVPSFSSLMINNRTVALAEEFNGALQLARAEAIKRRQSVTLCASNDGSSCGSDWSAGFIVVADSAASETDESVGIDRVEDVVNVWRDLGADFRIIQPQGEKFLRYTSTGRLARVGAQPKSFVISVAGCKSADGARTFSVNLAGSISVGRSPCSQE